MFHILHGQVGEIWSIQKDYLMNEGYNEQKRNIAIIIN